MMKDVQRPNLRPESSQIPSPPASAFESCLRAHLVEQQRVLREQVEHRRRDQQQLLHQHDQLRQVLCRLEVELDRLNWLLLKIDSD